ncbi:MAG: dipeptide ABC transporter ATP-binding protein [Paracoccaceae bacterium]
MSFLEIENLKLSIHGTPILKNISLKAERGEKIGVIGESGSGKSMTAFCVMGLLPPGAEVSGSIKLDEQPLLQKTERQMCALRGNDIGMIFQEPMTALNPVKTIGDQVAETVLIHGGATRTEARKIARATLNRVGLPADQFPLNRYPHELSGGQRQRVVIAMAIALRPKLLIADEPTTALDVTTQAQILALLEQLVVEDGMCLMLITHDLAVVSDVADHLVIMKSGKVVESGETRKVFHEMQHPYTRALFTASSHVPDRDRQSETKDMPVLEVKSVVRDYAIPRKGLFAKQTYFRAVDAVSFAIKRGESLGLVGESGCGKSTLTRAILGLDAVQGGTICVAGTAVSAGSHMPRALRRKMQVVFQDPYGSFNPRHKVARLIAEPFHLLDNPPSGSARQLAVDEALRSVGMVAADAQKYIHEFSGGQRQRIAIARALIIRPDLIILDEAVSALDVSVRAQILDLLAELSDRLKLSYLFISHDLSVVRSITERVIIMKSGVIVEHGETKTVFENPQHPYTQELINAAPNLQEILTKEIV